MTKLNNPKGASLKKPVEVVTAIDDTVIVKLTPTVPKEVKETKKK